MANDDKKPTTVSKREVLDAEGNVQPDWLNAGGIRYHALAEKFSIDLMFEGANAIPREALLGLAAFGGLTLAGNVTNQVRNGDKSPFKNETEALQAWVESLMQGNWPSARGDGEAGPTALLAALVRVKEAADGRKRTEEDVAKIKAWLDADGVAEKDRKAEQKKRRAQARDTAGVSEMILQMQMEKLAARRAESAPKADDIPG